MKNWVAFILGIVAGVVLVFNFFLFGWIFIPGEKNDNITLFEEPGENLKISSLCVYEILTDSTAYVIDENDRGQKYLLIDKKCKYFYDYQSIEIPIEKCVKMIGVYEDLYDHKIPVVKIMDSGWRIPDVEEEKDCVYL